MALAGEAGELVAEFQWLTPEQSLRQAMSPEKLAAVESEMADVLIYLVQLAGVLEVDLPNAVEAKMAVNAARFPVPDPN
jgi:NTP pyrophosphatase (non-canonical NTP hydrolase)